MANAEQSIDEKKLSNWKLLDEFRRRLAVVQAKTQKPATRPGGPERMLLEENYFSLVLFGLFNPVIKTMRGLCFASHLKRVQDEVCGRPVSLGSFSEGKALLDMVKQGEVIVGDRYYGLEYAYFGELRKRGASSVIRIRNNPRMEVIEEMPLTDADRAGGVTWQGRVKLGDGTHPALHDGLRRTRRGHHAVSTAKIQSLIPTGYPLRGRLPGLGVPGFQALDTVISGKCKQAKRTSRKTECFTNMYRSSI